MFSRDLALLLRTGARIDDALELLALDSENRRMRSTVAHLLEAVLGGRSFNEALAALPDIFPPLYVALARVGEATSMLPTILEAIADERARAESLRRQLLGALRYPAFLLVGAGIVLIFFLTFVLPQFAAVFADFNAKPDPVLATFLMISSVLRENWPVLAGGSGIVALALGFAVRRRATRAVLVGYASRLPWIGAAIEYHRTILFCRNLSLLLTGGVTLSSALRILVEVMASTARTAVWMDVVDSVRRGGKLSEALSGARVLPPMAVRTLRLGESPISFPCWLGGVELITKKTQPSDLPYGGCGRARSDHCDHMIVGGLIVSVITALLSLDEMVE